MLLFVLIVCALGVVTSQHKARRAYIELQKAQAEARRLDVEWGQLQLEQSTWAMHSRIEKEATNRLGMRVVDPTHTQLAPVAAANP
ncbi:cell division protein FtsL [Chitinimonas sp. BJYL2]|uniref:cell division protein FtsL n=1 Tax=Chitinimonas sp. BJYL2 TaxID=2976696 RepID=UPI0022B58A14|nr:cell division protein FtsL [Chitinimonas sp. BJYL2]